MAFFKYSEQSGKNNNSSDEDDITIDESEFTRGSNSNIKSGILSNLKKNPNDEEEDEKEDEKEEEGDDGENPDECDDSADETEDGDDKKDSDDSPNYRDKKKEFRELKDMIKNQLSLDTQEAINKDENEMDKIIEKLKTKGLSKDNGIELHKIRNIKKSPRIHLNKTGR